MALFSKFSFRQNRKSNVQNDGDPALTHASKAVEFNPTPTAVLEITKPGESTSQISVEAGNDEHDSVDSPEMSTLQSQTVSAFSAMTQNRLTRDVHLLRRLSREIRIKHSNSESSRPFEPRGNWTSDFSISGFYMRSHCSTRSRRCEKRVAKKVRNFFNQKHVQEDLGSDFQVHIVDSGLVSLSLGSILVHTARDFHPMCGKRIVLAHEDGSNTTLATLGGIILVTSGNETTPYGITAGHAIAKAYGQEYFEVLNTHSDQGDDSSSDDDDDSPLNEGPAVSGPGEMTRELKAQHANTYSMPTAIGYVDGVMLPPQTADYDWGLLTLLYKPKGNYRQISRGPVFEEMQPLFSKKVISLERRTTVAVVVVTSHGEQGGTLAANGSLILSAIGNAFVPVFDFAPGPASVLTQGDSGAWVVNERTGEGYGHLVSIDAFGEAYVMPIQNTLEEIKTRLHADSVFLPSREQCLMLEAVSRFHVDSGYSTMHNSPQY